MFDEVASRWRAYPVSDLSAAFAAFVATPGVDAFALIRTIGLVGIGVPLRCCATHAGVVCSALATACVTCELWTTRAKVLASPSAASSDPATEAAFECVDAQRRQGASWRCRPADA